MNLISRSLFIIVIPIAISILFFFEQIFYAGDVIFEKIDDRLSACTTSERGVVSGNIVYDFECTSLAYLNEFVISEGHNAVLNLFGEGLIKVEINEINNSLNTIKSSKLNLLFELDNPVPKSFTDGYGFSNKEAEIVTLATHDYEPGWYEIVTEDSHGKHYHLVFFIESSERSNVLFVESTDTLIAYNETFRNTGIPNNYKRSVTQKTKRKGTFPKYVPVEHKITPSKFYPVRCNAHLISADIVLKQYLQKNGISFTEVSDSQLDIPITYENVDTIIFGAHNEYWTKEKIKLLSAFVEHGGKLLFLGGNQAYREIIRHENYWMIRNDNFKTDEQAFTSISQLMGTFFEGDMGTSAPLRVFNSETWQREFGIDNVNNDIFGDGSDFSYCNAPYNFNPIGFMHGASSIETDQLIGGVNGFHLLAKGMQQNGGADIVYKEFKGGGKLLNLSSVGLWHSLSDPYISELITRFMQKN